MEPTGTRSGTDHIERAHGHAIQSIFDAAH